MKNLTSFQKRVLLLISLLVAITLVVATELAFQPSSALLPAPTPTPNKPLVVKSGSDRETVNFQIDHESTVFIMVLHDTGNETIPLTTILYDDNNQQLDLVLHLGQNGRLSTRRVLKPGHYRLEVQGGEWTVIVD